MNQYRHRTPSDDPTPVFSTRLFIVEDDDELRALMADAFRRDGYQVIEAVDGPDLVDHLIHAGRHGYPVNNHDVVVSDFRMPGFNGLQLLASFHNLHMSTPFILISAFIDSETEQRALRLGAVAVFSKPVDLDDLRRAVSKLVAREGMPPPATFS